VPSRNIGHAQHRYADLTEAALSGSMACLVEVNRAGPGFHSNLLGTLLGTMDPGQGSRAGAAYSMYVVVCASLRTFCQTVAARPATCRTVRSLELLRCL